MASVKGHYGAVLADVYAWMAGGFETALERNRAFFDALSLRPTSSGIAVDLGAGCGFQSIPLAELGFHVTAIDLDRRLLDELESNAGSLEIRIVEDDLTRFRDHVDANAELVVCMTDTLLHLESKERVQRLLSDVNSALGPDGKFVITFRDLTRELADLDRFIPVRSDAETILMCFLEYEPATVKVHDLVYKRTPDGWNLSKSYYRKLRLSKEWVHEQLEAAGFARIDAREEAGLVTMLALP
jgi:2-polyprenyl-3-methyl-5-hydroxy-6-metoxy-1,4-benzoquinol methylase